MKRPYVTLFTMILFLGSSSSLSAFEGIAKHSHILKCQTSCHKAKNIAQALSDKETRTECKTCHVGTGSSPRSPFSPPSRILLAGSSGTIKKPVSTAPADSPHKAQAPSFTGKVSQKTRVSQTTSMALIPRGEFVMGSNERWDDEAPEYIESVETFHIDLHEVTNANYHLFVSATKREPPYHWSEGNIPAGKEGHPVIYVSWHDANAYCKWSGKRLPTEQEWEKAARGENGNIYPWGNEWSLDKSNNPYKGSTGTQPVGTYPEGRSPYGLYDMSGNVWEWVDSFYLPHPGNTIPRAEYGKDKRVLKGGSWFDCLSYGCGLSAPTFNRSFFTPEVKNNSFGFRCAKSP
ncbi:MAG: formylglycine-generating enzyme family protein [Nitrospinaceae bacterium]|nr:formylglycine-generating enzyme family protein [Nitrospinaceae bacterium]